MAAYSSAQQEALKEFKQDIGHLNALSNSSRQKLIMILGAADNHVEGNMVYYYLTLNDTIARLERLTNALKRQIAQA